MSTRQVLQTLAISVIAATAGGSAVAAYEWPWSAAIPSIPGMVRQTEIRIAPDSTGRLKSISVRAGQHVVKGEVLAVLDNPELAASVEEAKAAAATSKADRDRVYTGVRAEEVAIAAQNVKTAEANLLLAEKVHERKTALLAKSFASRQELDESSASLAKAQADLDLKRAEYAAANAGPIPEERALADAKVVLAEATVADLEAKLDKTKLVAPVDGVIGVQVAEPGEIISPGKPILTMAADGEQWFTFAVREDSMIGMRMGETITVTGDSGRPIDARVIEIRPLGEFATWRAARAVGDHDLNSFWVRLDPLVKHEELKPGMTVWIPGRS